MLVDQVRTARLSRILNSEDARRQARRRLPRVLFEFVDGGAEDEITLRRNGEAFRDWCFRPRMAVWVDAPQLETTVLGERVSMPLLLAPCGGMRLIHPAGDLGVAGAATRLGTVYVVSSSSGHTLEQVAAAAGSSWFQLYRLGGREGMERLVERARDAGYRTIVVTVDTAVTGMRERDFHNGFTLSMRVNARHAARLAPQLARRPSWVWRFWRDGMPFDIANSAGLRQDGRAVPLTELLKDGGSSSPTWADIAWVREHWEGQLVIKGVVTADDAHRAVAAGADGVVVSNHGGRQLESAPASLDALPEVVAAIGAEAEVLLDGGVRRGGDVLKALALGARAVLIGRPYVYGLALAGQTGVEHVLGLFRSQMVRTMQLMGCPSIDELDASWLVSAGTRA